MCNLKSYMLSIMTDKRKTPDAFPIKIILSFISLGYLALLQLIYLFYRARILPSRRIAAKVISVGNITLGGTGKTPFTIALAKNIKAMGAKPAVLHRGYGDDETHLLREKLEEIPVLTGRDRVKNALKAYCGLGRDCIVLDDGFQHYRIKRDLDIILVDATQPFRDMKLFPRGILREPLTRLKDADIAVLTKTDMEHGNVPSLRKLLKQLNGKIEIAESFYQPLDFKDIFTNDARPLSYVAEKKIALLAGIANPDYFEWKIAGLKAEIKYRFYYPDHHPYSTKDIKRAIDTCLAEGINTIITTEKDAVRLKRLKAAVPEAVRILALRINFKFSVNEEAVVGRLHSIFGS